MRHPLSAKVGTNFADKRQSLIENIALVVTCLIHIQVLGFDPG
jgi:hypothetical protein